MPASLQKVFSVVDHSIERRGCHIEEWTRVRAMRKLRPTILTTSEAKTIQWSALAYWDTGQCGFWANCT